ncbi:hypothetical protein AB0C89_11620 [Streptomyces sp. NPDC048491]|uniref:hypothetical protein n=1 Tax=Streptomyces sp. NPDC048491 TaxID=3157207 RepID=UPI003442C108
MSIRSTARFLRYKVTRTTEDMAVVVLADKCEQERRAEANALEYQHLGGAAEDARAEV